MDPEAVEGVGVDFMHRIGLGLLDFALLYLERDQVARSVFAEHEVPKSVHQSHGDTFATAPDSKVQEKRVVSVQLCDKICVGYFSIMLLLLFVFFLLILGLGCLGCFGDDVPQKVYSDGVKNREDDFSGFLV